MAPKPPNAPRPEAFSPTDLSDLSNLMEAEMEGLPEAEAPLLLQELLQWLRSEDGGGAAALEIVRAGGAFSTAATEGAPRRSKATNPAGTNPADVDVVHALAAAGLGAAPWLLQCLTSADDDDANAPEPWHVQCAAATLLGVLPLGGPNSAASCEVVCAALVRAAARESSGVWVRRNACEALGAAAQALQGEEGRRAVAAALTQALTVRRPRTNPLSEPSVLEAEDDDYCGGQSVVACAALSIAQLAVAWRGEISCCSRSSGNAGSEVGFDIAATTESLSPLVEVTAVGAEGGAAGHRLRTTIADYAAHALRCLECLEGGRETPASL